jgi:hypothetical protein
MDVAAAWVGRFFDGLALWKSVMAAVGWGSLHVPASSRLHLRL